MLAENFTVPGFLAKEKLMEKPRMAFDVDSLLMTGVKPLPDTGMFMTCTISYAGTTVTW